MEISLADWNQKALDTAADARNRFLALVKARESLATRSASLAVARRVHEENEARVKAGVLAAFELQDSEFGVLQREKDLLDAELAERDAADQLRLTLHLPAGTEHRACRDLLDRRPGSVRGGSPRDRACGGAPTC